MTISRSGRRLNGMSRRKFITAAGGGAAAIGLSSWSGRSRAIARQADGATFNLAYLWPTKSIEPHGPQDNPTLIALVPMYEGLVGYKTGSLDLEPILAESWDVAEDGLTYSFTLRQGVKFHDGADFNAAAARTSLERLFRLGTGPGAVIQENIATIDTPDDYTLVVTATSPYAPLLATLGSTFIVSPKALEEHGGSDDAQGWLSENEAGTGPYMLQSWERDQSMTMTRFPDYWRGWPENPLETIVVRYIAEQATQRQLVETGEVQMAMAIAVDDLAQLGENPALQVQSSPSIREYLIRFDNQRPPLDDPLVRQAIIHAFDYQTTVDELLGGFGQIPEGYVPTLYRTHDSSLGPETFDLTKAKQMLDASSSPEGVTFSCTYIGNLDIQRQTAELWQAYLSQIGVTLNLNPQPWATMVERSQSPDTRDNAGYFAFNYGNLDETFAQWQTLSSNTNAAWGNYGYQNQAIDDLLDQALTTIDDEERTGILHEAQRLAREDAATVNVLIFEDWVVASSAVQGYVYDPGRPTIPPFYSMSLA